MGGDRLWVDGRIYTGRRRCEALLVENGRVVLAGTEAEARRQRPTGAETVHLAGRSLVPGLIDSHLHVGEIARARDGVSLAGAASVTEILARAREWTTRHPTGPIVGRGWDAERLAEGRPPSREQLDRLSDDRPVILYHVSGHTAVANGRALEEAGIDPRTHDPTGGHIDRAPDGTATGLLQESALELVAPIARSGFPTTSESIRATLSSLAALGLTTVVSMHSDWPELSAMTELGSEIPIRVREFVSWQVWEARGDSNLASLFPTPEKVRIAGVKSFADGAFGPRTAWLAEPYSDAPGTTGTSVATWEQLVEIHSEVRAAGLAHAIHALGDRAVEQAIRLLARSGPPPPGAPPDRIEHAGLIPPALWPELDRVRPALVVQPGFLWSDVWLESRLGAHRVRWAYPFRTMIEGGRIVAGSSDAPFDSPDPWPGLRACVSRRNPAGLSANPAPEEELGPDAALRMYTVAGGEALGEPTLGRLEAGSHADFVCVGAGGLAEAFAHGSHPPLETWVAGECVHRSPLPGPAPKRV